MSCAGCDGVSNSGKTKDACGICGGNGMSCAGCDGVSNSGKTNDACGICGGNGMSCAGCDGVSNSGKTIDACGVCGGNGRLQLFRLSGQTTTVAEFAAIGTKVYTVPKPTLAIESTTRQGLRYSIKNSGAGPAAIPFIVNQKTGVVTIKTVTNCEAAEHQQVWNVFVTAKATPTSTTPNLDKCLLGGIALQVTIKCGLYCGASERIVGNPPNTKCTACAFGQYQPKEKHRNQCIAQKACSYGDYYYAASLAVLSTCKDCPSALLYQSSKASFATECTIQPTCSQKGQLYSVKTAYVTKAACSNCPATTYQDATNHRTAACKSQPYCEEGQQITAYSDEKAQTCAACDKHFYQTKKEHRDTSCSLQPACDAGTDYVTNTTAVRTCAACNLADNKYQDVTNHRSRCKSATTCTSGQYETAAPTAKTNRRCAQSTVCNFSTQWESKAMTKTTDRECTAISTCGTGYFVSVVQTQTSDLICEACPENTYQDKDVHRSEQCIVQTTCDKGFAISPDSFIEARACSACPSNTFMIAIDHRIEECTVQPTCWMGEKISADTFTAARTCSECGINTYQEQPEHRLTECELQPLCGPGERINADSKIKTRECLPCPANTFQHLQLSAHREMKCTPQGYCGPGEYASPDTKLQMRECAECPLGTFMVESSHRNNACDGMKVCGPGEKFVDYFYDLGKPTTSGECEPCREQDGEYQDAVDHRSTVCFVQPTCSTGEQYVPSITAERTCVVCEAGTYQDEADHVDESCHRYTTLTCGEDQVIRNLGSKLANQYCEGCPEGLVLPEDEHTEDVCVRPSTATTSASTTPTSTATSSETTTATITPSTGTPLSTTMTVSSTTTTISTTTDTTTTSFTCPDTNGWLCNKVGECKVFANLTFDNSTGVPVDLARSSYYCDCPFPFYGKGCELETFSDPCNWNNCKNGGVCKPARRAGIESKLTPVDDFGLWDTSICICAYNNNLGLCYAGLQCRESVDCIGNMMADTTSCVHAYSNGNTTNNKNKLKGNICHPECEDAFVYKCIPYQIVQTSSDARAFDRCSKELKTGFGRLSEICGDATCTFTAPMLAAAGRSDNGSTTTPSDDGDGDGDGDGDDDDDDVVETWQAPQYVCSKKNVCRPGSMNQYCLEPLVEFVDADDADELIPTLDTQMSVGMIICVCTVLIILALILLLWLWRRRNANLTVLSDLKMHRNATLRNKGGGRGTENVHYDLTVGADRRSGVSLTPNVLYGADNGGASAGAYATAADAQYTNPAFNSIGAQALEINHTYGAADAAVDITFLVPFEDHGQKSANASGEYLEVVDTVNAIGEYLEVVDTVNAIGEYLEVVDTASPASRESSQRLGMENAAYQQAVPFDRKASVRSAVAAATSTASAEVGTPPGGGYTGSVVYDATGGILTQAPLLCTASARTGDALAVLRSSGSLAARPRLDEWIQLATLPESSSGLNGRTCKQHLLACGTGPGTYCFRPSSKSANTVVVCVLVDSASVAHIRIQCNDDGSVHVFDLAETPIKFPSFDAALKHLEDHNTVRISDCMEIPDDCRRMLNQRSASVSVRRLQGGSRV